MKQYHSQWRTYILEALVSLGETPIEELSPLLISETPPDPAMGDVAFPMFPFARVLRKNPAVIAQEVAGSIRSHHGEAARKIQAAGPYVNIFLKRYDVTVETLKAVLESGDAYGTTDKLKGQRIMVEFSAPNTNKPLHLGHLRNDALGESVARILAAAGADVRKVNLINDRGIHICKSMLAYHTFGGGDTPESTGIKSDHFVGDYYVRYAQWEKEDPSVEERARELLQKWEAGDEETVELWKLMNSWAIEGVGTTYDRTGISFDKIYLESETYRLGKDEVLKGIDSGVFFRDEEGTIWVDLADIDLDRKVLLRSDGTSLYLTQDIGTAIERHREWPFDQLVYVVASEQRYHFQVLFEVLRRLGMKWADNLHHLSYGMVNLPEGKMKSREGTVVDADDLLDELSSMAQEEIRAKGRDEELDDPAATAEKVALAALHYYLLQTSPVKDMIFDPKESLSFNGNTGPYLQYVGARVAGLLRKADWDGDFSSDLVEEPDSIDEWVLVRQIATFPDICADAAVQYNPSLLANSLFEIAKTFSRFYHDHPIAVADDEKIRTTRLALSQAVSIVMRKGLNLLNIPYVDAM